MWKGGGVGEKFKLFLVLKRRTWCNFERRAWRSSRVVRRANDTYFKKVTIFFQESLPFVLPSDREQFNLFLDFTGPLFLPFSSTHQHPLSDKPHCILSKLPSDAHFGLVKSLTIFSARLANMPQTFLRRVWYSIVRFFDLWAEGRSCIHWVAFLASYFKLLAVALHLEAILFRCFSMFSMLSWADWHSVRTEISNYWNHQGTVPERPISANRGLKFCSTAFCIYLPMHCLEQHFVLTFLFFEVKAQQCFLRSSFMFLD